MPIVIGAIFAGTEQANAKDAMGFRDRRAYC